MKQFAPNMSLEEKIKDILASKRMENPQEDIRRAQTYLLMDLFFRGYQQVGPWDTVSMGWPVYDEQEIGYQENRFRGNVLINAGSLIKMEPSPVLRPASGSIEDLEAAQTAQDAWEKAKEEICYDRVLADKSLYKPLFGNAFVYSGYNDKRGQTILVPKIKYEDAEIPGGAICTQCGAMEPTGMEVCQNCGAPMQQIPAMPIQNPTVAGYDQRQAGELFSTVFTPLEIKIRSKVKGGLQNAPYLLRIWREDLELLDYVYPGKIQKQNQFQGMDYSHRTDGGSDAMLRYQQLLAALPGNPNGSASPFWTTTQDYDQCDVIMGWLTPQTFRGDKALLKEFPNGLMAVMCGTQLVDYAPENLTDVWTHEVYFPNAHSAYGDGMYDDIPIQRSINKVGMLTERHLEYDTIPLRLFDDSLISTKDVSNDPGLKWIPVKTELERGLDQAVKDLPAQNLSFDVSKLYADRLSASERISGATDPLAGQIAGANTPYSAQLLAVEQGQTRFLPTSRYNKDAVKAHVTQVLQLAQKFWTDERTLTEIDKNTGRSTWKQFTGTDLSRGNWNVYVGDSDFKPRTRGEQMQALDMARQYGVDVMATPKMRLQFFEKVGLDPSGDMLSTQARRAGRIIDWYRQGLQYQPNPLVDDGVIQAPVLLEFLASPQGDDLNEQQPEVFQGLVMYVQTVLQIAAMKNAAMGNMGLPVVGGMPMPPQGKPPQGGDGQKQEMAQSNQVPEGSKMPMPQSPARQQQGAGVLPQ